MKHQPREVLKSYFLEGRRPTADEFGQLIDSMLNLNDEGFNKTRSDGLRITSLGDSKSLLSFFHPNANDYFAEWSMGFGSDRDQLAFHRPAPNEGGDGPMPAPLLTLDARTSNGARAPRRVGVNTFDPQDELHVDGVVRAGGRRGIEKICPADGRFHPLTDYLTGCQAFEVVAGAGHKGSGRFALMHATALNAFNPTWWDNFPFNKRPIRAQHAFYSRRADRIELRWVPHPGEPSRGHGRSGLYRLEMRTRSSYIEADGSDGGDGGDVQVRAYVTKLWFDDFSEPAEAR
ncbi:MAG TPA: hypothetical protein VGC92_12780 [Phenylobacterium sp.]